MQISTAHRNKGKKLAMYKSLVAVKSPQEKERLERQIEVADKTPFPAFPHSKTTNGGMEISLQRL
jgi:hypothetical protein